MRPQGQMNAFFASELTSKSYGNFSNKKKLLNHPFEYTLLIEIDNLNRKRSMGNGKLPKNGLPNLHPFAAFGWREDCSVLKHLFPILIFGTTNFEKHFCKK